MVWIVTVNHVVLKENKITTIKIERKIKKKYRDWRLQRVYNISLEEYEIILESQDNKCKICGAKENLSGAHHKIGHKNLVVDHDHVTNKIRGLLCDKCNRGLGAFNDNIELLAKAIEYLSV